MQMAEKERKEHTLLCWADEEYLVGQQLVTQTGFYGPDLEEAVTIGSVAQDHLGYAYQLLKEFISDDNREIDRYLFERDLEAYQVGLLAQAWDPFDWAFIVVKEYLYDSACLARAQILKLEYSSLAGLAEMILRETDFRLRHWREWLHLLASQLEGQKKVNQILGSLLAMARQAQVGAPNDAQWFEHCANELKSLGYLIPNPIPFPTVSGLLPMTKVLLENAHSYYRTHPEWVWG